jgi:hypothetical protein
MTGTSSRFGAILIVDRQACALRVGVVAGWVRVESCDVASRMGLHVWENTLAITLSCQAGKDPHSDSM